MDSEYNILLVVVIASLVIFALAGYKRGLIRSIYSVLTIIGAIAITMIFSSSVESFLVRSTVIPDVLSSQIDTLVKLPGFQEGVSSLDAEKLLGSTELPEAIINSANEFLNEFTALGDIKLEDFKLYIVPKIAGLFVKGIAVVITFIISIIVLRLLGKLLDLAVCLPVISQINSIGGMVVGAVEGIITLWLFFIVVKSTANLDFSKNMLELIHSSSILSVAYNSNLLALWIF